MPRSRQNNVASTDGVNHVKGQRGFVNLRACRGPCVSACVGSGGECWMASLLCSSPYRISKGLSEVVFAKSEEQRRTAEEDVEDTGTVKLLKSCRCDLHL